MFNAGELVLPDTKNLPLTLVSSAGSNKLKHRFIGPFTVLAGTVTSILVTFQTTHPTFYVGRLKRYHDSRGSSRQLEEYIGESTPRNETVSSGQPGLPVSEPVNGSQAGTHAIHTKGRREPNVKSSRKSQTYKPDGTNALRLVRGHPTVYRMA
ncbi:LOW QUALITY PROTEIN: Pol protein [Phytophthora palmivora]|uniref:Pol protein n=1 Tax=Phytophthora palmivora TaxID=4796 RepID=A0A2P4XJU3_9STRA|nr:LOW QUALITY PROTEIN: Pol protein [Phytophthora palmivora]